MLPVHHDVFPIVGLNFEYYVALVQCLFYLYTVIGCAASLQWAEWTQLPPLSLVSLVASDRVHSDCLLV